MQADEVVMFLRASDDGDEKLWARHDLQWRTTDGFGMNTSLTFKTSDMSDNATGAVSFDVVRSAGTMSFVFQADDTAIVRVNGEDREDGLGMDMTLSEPLDIHFDFDLDTEVRVVCCLFVFPLFVGLGCMYLCVFLLVLLAYTPFCCAGG